MIEVINLVDINDNDGAILFEEPHCPSNSIYPGDI